MRQRSPHRRAISMAANQRSKQINQLKILFGGLVALSLSVLLFWFAWSLLSIILKLVLMVIAAVIGVVCLIIGICCVLWVIFKP